MISPPMPAEAPRPERDGVTDPMERIVADALSLAGFTYRTDQGGGTASNLDFEVKDGPAIEVKRLHSARIAAQMARAEDVIAIQGEGAVRWFATILVRLVQAERRAEKAERVAGAVKRALARSDAEIDPVLHTYRCTHTAFDDLQIDLRATLTAAAKGTGADG